MSSSTTKVCFNSYCKGASDSWRRGWRRRTGDYAHLCDRCASAYEEGKFCETFHLNASGWRCCESCGKQVHCGCIVSFHMFVLLDAGGIECLSCARKSFILTPNPAWPPPSHFLPSQPERMKDLSGKNWSAIAGSGPVPWRQAPSLFNSSNSQSEAQLRTPFDVDMSGGVDRFRICERLSTISPEVKHASSYERLSNGKLRFGPSETLQNGNAGLNKKELPCCSIVDSRPLFLKNESSSNMNLTAALPSKMETDGTQLPDILSQPPAFSVPLGKLVCGHIALDSSNDAQIRYGKARADARGRIQLLPRYHPQITNEELQQISSESKSVITPLFEKMLSASDAGRIGRLVLPKKCAEAYFPPIAQPEGLPLKVQDVKGKEWVFQFRFWPNNNSRMYVLEGITPCIQSMQLQAGDIVTFSRLQPEGKLVMGGRKASKVSSSVQADEHIVMRNDASFPRDDSAKSKAVEVISVNGHSEDEHLSCNPPVHQSAKADRGGSCSEIDKVGLFAKGLESKPPVDNKRKKTSYLGARKKRLRIENEDMVELKLTWKEAQGLMRAPAKIVPSIFVVEGCEFEEFEEAGPVIGRPTIPGMDQFGKKIQWVQCEDCFKWRKVPADAILPSRWVCSENVWDLDRSLCSTTEELEIEQLEDFLPAINQVSSKTKEVNDQESDLFVTLQGLDTLADLAIQDEGDDPPNSSESRTKHPRHKAGCSCIVCLQPPSGKGSKHKQSCDCVVCTSLKRRFKTLMERREKKQLEKEAESVSHTTDQVRDVDTYPATGSLNHEDEGKNGSNYNHNGINSSTSPLKGQIDLNIQPDREEELLAGSDLGSMKRVLPGAAERFFRQQPRPLGSIAVGDLVGKQMQQERNWQSEFH